LICAVKACQVSAAKASKGPPGCLLSRTATAGPAVPTSTQVPPLLPFLGHFPDQVAGRGPRFGLCAESIERESDMSCHGGAVGGVAFGRRLQVDHRRPGVEVRDHEVGEQARVGAGGADDLDGGLGGVRQLRPGGRAGCA
jgi:hypothetical protein